MLILCSIIINVLLYVCTVCVIMLNKYIYINCLPYFQWFKNICKIVYFGVTHYEWEPTLIWSKKNRLKLWFISEMLYKCTQWPVHCTDVQLYTITRIRTLPGRVQNSGGVDNGEGNITSRLNARMYVSIETPRIHIIGFVKCRF